MGFIPRNGDFCLWFDWWRFLPELLIDGFYPKKWRLLPVVWLMATSAWMIDWLVSSREMTTSACGLIDVDFCQNDWLTGFTPRMATSACVLMNDDFCQWLINGFCPEKWQSLPMFGSMATSTSGLIDGNICQTSNNWASSPRNVYITISWDFIMGCYLFNGLLPLRGLISQIFPFNGLISKVCPFSGLISEVCPFSGFISELCPFSGLINKIYPFSGLIVLGFPPLVVWSYPHQWLHCWVVSPSVVWFWGRIPVDGLIFESYHPSMVRLLGFTPLHLQ